MLRQNNFICLLQKCRLASSKANVKSTGKVENLGKSLAAKGFLRPQKPYNPPEDAQARVQAICSSLKIPTTATYKFTDLNEKFQILEACFKDFKHSVPNSLVHEMETVKDVENFYKEKLDTTVPYDALKNMDLPENLHIQYDYVRFNPATDTKFNGKSAFPKSSTLVTGLKYREKYEGYEAKRSWP